MHSGAVQLSKPKLCFTQAGFRWGTFTDAFHWNFLIQRISVKALGMWIIKGSTSQDNDLFCSPDLKMFEYGCFEEAV